MELKDKVIIVTGGSGLIGQSILTDLRQQGAIAINADINSALNNDELFYFCDITKVESVNLLINELKKKYGRIDGLVNNAYPRTKDWGTKFEDISMQSWQQNVDMQLNSLFYISQCIIKEMKEERNGSIVNIASIYGIVGNDFSVYKNTDGMTSPAAYSAIKGGIVNLTRYLSSYLGEYNIRVNCVSPGGVFNNQHPNFVKQYSKRVPLKRLASPDEISPAVTFLLSEGARYITGHNLVVDGGWTAI